MSSRDSCVPQLLSFQSALNATKPASGLFRNSWRGSVALTCNGLNCPAVWVESVISASSWLSCLCCWGLTLSKSLCLIWKDTWFRAETETPQVPSAQTSHMQRNAEISGHLRSCLGRPKKMLRYIEVKPSWLLSCNFFLLQAAFTVTRSKLETFKTCLMRFSDLNQWYPPQENQI